MIIRLLVLLLFSTRAVAEVGVIERIEDCLGPRALARSLEQWNNAPCQKSQSCPPFDAVLSETTNSSLCLFEAYTVYATDDALIRAECVTRVDGFVETEIARVIDDVTESRLLTLKENASGIGGRTIDRFVGGLRNPEPIDCKKWDYWPFNAKDTEVNCSHVVRVLRYSHLSGMERYVLRKEAGK